MTTNGESTSDGSGFPLTDEHRMLIQMRDTLYEGVWQDFLDDLRARQEGRAYVFSTIPESASMTKTVERHILLINEMWNWERENQSTLTPDRG